MEARIVKDMINRILVMGVDEGMDLFRIKSSKAGYEIMTLDDLQGIRKGGVALVMDPKDYLHFNGSDCNYSGEPRRARPYPSDELRRLWDMIREIPVRIAVTHIRGSWGYMKAISDMRIDDERVFHEVISDSYCCSSKDSFREEHNIDKVINMISKQL